MIPKSSSLWDYVAISRYLSGFRQRKTAIHVKDKGVWFNSSPEYFDNGALLGSELITRNT